MKNSLLTLLFLSILLTSTGTARSADKIRVLILTGKNNHNWKATTPFMEKVLKDTEMFEVETALPQEGLNEKNLKKFDVILSNWNSFGKGSAEAEDWGDDAKKAYLDFVKGGKGHVTIHAGGSSFYKDWPEYRDVTLLYWEMGKTGHGRQHEFKVRIDKPGHPVVAGLQDFQVMDELWEKPGYLEDVLVLTSSLPGNKNDATWHASTFVTTYGMGRCFATSLGHGVNNMDNDAFKQLLIRGTEWAATGKVTAPTATEETLHE
ncbi:MAG: ThuA domain-containing protein [Kiritimatiellia bacterium]|nr:ThuA domain-containing protein [Kiritimatiellia bacterium]MDP6848065.1 ThuA domain-containing protein [Kiritimatiellia bacterium]